jgi:hypothetical protein
LPNTDENEKPITPSCYFAIQQDYLLNGKYFVVAETINDKVKLEKIENII